MAISKNLTSDNGVPVLYHRVVAYHVVVNSAIVVEIGSYVDQNARLSEKSALLTTEEEEADRIRVLVEGSIEQLPYSESITIEGIYNAIKDLDKYNGAIDV